MINESAVEDLSKITIKAETAFALGDGNGSLNIKDAQVLVSAILAKFGKLPDDFRTILFFEGKLIICGSTFMINCERSLDIAKAKYCPTSESYTMGQSRKSVSRKRSAYLHTRMAA